MRSECKPKEFLDQLFSHDIKVTPVLTSFVVATSVPVAGSVTTAASLSSPFASTTVVVSVPETFD